MSYRSLSTNIQWTKIDNAQKPNCYRLFFCFGIYYSYFPVSAFAIEVWTENCVCCLLNFYLCLFNWWIWFASSGPLRRNFPCGRRPMTGMGKDLVSFPMECLFEVIFVGWNHSLLNGNIAIASCRVIKKTYTKNRILTITINFKTYAYINIINVCTRRSIMHHSYMYIKCAYSWFMYAFLCFWHDISFLISKQMSIYIYDMYINPFVSITKWFCGPVVPYLQVLLSLLQMFLWFGLLQLVLAYYSGAIGKNEVTWSYKGTREWGDIYIYIFISNNWISYHIFLKWLLNERKKWTFNEEMPIAWTSIRKSYHPCKVYFPTFGWCWW